jgi:phosphoadenosine phosphosulfate reductase
MYSYTHDSETGGLLLNSTPSGKFSKEPRPVYAQELDILGFNVFWNYDKQNKIPYLWAEHNEYYYRGKLVAKVKGGDLRTKPEIEILAELPHCRGVGAKLQPVDLPLMIKKNRELLDAIEKVTLKRIFDVYKRYNGKLDVFYVAFSGGKDSLVLLNLVKKALSKEQFVIVFGDTGMEFPDTEETVKKIEKQCKKDGGVFLQAKSVYSPQESWELFGPPSRRIRWCCSVHKTVPQNLQLREFLKKNDYTGLAFVGVRGFESLSRSEYDYESYSAKVKGQHTSNPILDWTSAEIWLYTYAENVLINESYKKGHLRAGCIVCPMGGGKDDYMRQYCYSEEFSCFVDIIKKSVVGDKDKKDHYVENDNWRARLNGRDIQTNEKLKVRCTENYKDSYLSIEVKNPRTDWQEWIKPLGKLLDKSKKKRKISTEKEYVLLFDNKQYEFSLYTKEPETERSGYIVRIAEKAIKDNPSLIKYFKYVFRKAAYCVGCRLCSSNCCWGSISFENKLTIDCKHCGNRDCFNVAEGCLIANSVRIPMNNSRREEVKINCFTHAPKPEWIRDFFEKKDEFWRDNNLNPNLQVPAFKRFLRDSNLIEKNDTITTLVSIIKKLGDSSATSWGLALAQFAYNPEMRWFIENLEYGIDYSRQKFVDLLLAQSNCKPNDTSYILSAYRRFCNIPFGTALNFGYVDSPEEGKPIKTLRRNRCVVEDARVVLYSLYIYAEKSGNYQFRLSDLFEKREDALSPIQIFGLNRDTMEKMLLGLANSYPNFINTTFTHDLEKITLREEKTNDNVLTLF